MVDLDAPKDYVETNIMVDSDAPRNYLEAKILVDFDAPKHFVLPPKIQKQTPMQ